MAKSYYTVTNRKSLIDFLASGLITPTSQEGEDKIKIDRVFIYDSKISPYEFRESEDSYFKVILEIDRKFITFAKNNNFLSRPSTPYVQGEKCYAASYIPIYYAKSMIFRSEQEAEDFRVRGFSNADTGLLASSVNEKLFLSPEEDLFSKEKIQFMSDRSLSGGFSETGIPDFNIQDKIMGGFSVLINQKLPVLSQKMGDLFSQISSIISGKKLKKGTEELLLINQPILDFIFSGNFSDLVINKEVKFEHILMASLCRELAITESHKETLTKDVLFSAFDSIPRSLLPEEDISTLDECSEYIESVMSGNKQTGKFSDDRNIVLRAALYTLVNNADINFMLSEMSGEEGLEVGKKVLCTTLFFAGIFKGYSSLELRLKGDCKKQTVVSLALSSLLGAKISSEIILKEKVDAMTVQLLVQKEPVSEEIELSDPKLKFIVSRAREANYDFHPRGNLFYCESYDEGEYFEILIERIADNAFGNPVVRFSALLGQKTPSLTKVIEWQSSYDNHCYMTKIDGLHAVSICQLSNTADYDEIRSAIRDVINSRKKLFEVV